MWDRSDRIKARSGISGQEVFAGGFFNVLVRDAKKVVHLVRNGKLETGRLMRWMALSAVLLVLMMTGLETTHAHSDATVSRNSAPCAICITAHANAPALTVHFLPEIYTVETVAVAYAPEGKSAAPELQLFIRPPPSA